MTRTEDAQFAASIGVDAIGLIFARKSLRYILPEDAAAVTRTLPPFLQRIGVFVNEDLNSIVQIIRTAGLTGVQLHGDESPQFCRDLRNAVPALSLLRSVRVGDKTTSDAFIPYGDAVDGFVLDTYVKGMAGGTGQPFDWTLLQNLTIPKPFLLAGGLSPANIEQALAAVQPYGVDINSGVEVSPGVKDCDLMTQAVRSVRNFDGQESVG